MMSGKVKSWVDLTGIHPPTADIGANGIAYHPSSNLLLVTGKMWDFMYSIEIPGSVKQAVASPVSA